MRQRLAAERQHLADRRIRHARAPAEVDAAQQGKRAVVAHDLAQQQRVRHVRAVLRDVQLAPHRGLAHQPPEPAAQRAQRHELLRRAELGRHLPQDHLELVVQQVRDARRGARLLERERQVRAQRFELGRRLRAVQAPAKEKSKRRRRGARQSRVVRVKKETMRDVMCRAVGEGGVQTRARSVARR